MADLYGREARQDHEPRCWRCNRLLAIRLTRPWAIRCSRCKALCQDGKPGVENS